MDWNPLIELGKIVGGVAVAIAAVWKIVPKIWANIVGWIMHDVQEQMSKMSTDITYIVSELKTNGGSSLRDAIDRNNDEHIVLNKVLSNIESQNCVNAEVQRARMDNDNQMIFITDQKGDIEWVNRAYSRHTGRTLNEVVGSGWVNVLNPPGRDECVEDWYDSVKHNREFERVCNLIDTNGVPFDVDVKSYRMTDAHGNTTGFMGVGEVQGDGECPWLKNCEDRIRESKSE